MNGSSSSERKSRRARRLTAAFIDGLVAGAFMMLFGGAPLLGGIVGGAYLVVRDAVNLGPIHHRSVGKYAMGLSLVRLDGTAATVETSILRNWMFGLGAVASVLPAVPMVGGTLAPVVSFAGFGLFVYELYNVLTDPAGQRWGDRLAHTKVVKSGQSFF